MSRVKKHLTWCLWIWEYCWICLPCNVLWIWNNTATVFVIFMFYEILMHPDTKIMIQLVPIVSCTFLDNGESLCFAKICTTCFALTHWGWVMHICISKLTIIGSDNGLSPDRRQAIVWSDAGIVFIAPLATKFIEIYIFSLKKMHLKMSSAKWRSFCLGLNVLRFWNNIVTVFVIVMFYLYWNIYSSMSLH